MNPTREKVLLLLSAGLTLAFSHRPRQQWRIIATTAREWRKIDRQELRREINYLYKINIVDKVENSDGSIDVVLTERGVLRSLRERLDDMKNKKDHWDGKWRMVAFDMPERFRKGRDALRQTLKRVGFRELQKSVFICPYDCVREIRDLIDFFHLNDYVRVGVLEFIDNEPHLKKIFNLA